MKTVAFILLGLLCATTLTAQQLTPEQKEKYLINIDTPPEMIGGMAELAKWLVYPPEAIRDTIQGYVIVQAYVDETGTVVDVEVESSPHKLLSESACNAVRELKFSPGIHEGEKVNVRVSLPVRFRLD
ncbi:MAG TPA: energy transducer TonB [Bacteroidota bacterium]|nr:energy transducer TonB [Bacteroidota bacterium]